MKKIICGICALIILTGSMILYVHKNYPDSIMEIILSEYIHPKDIDDIIDETEIYDYLIVYDLFSSEVNAKVYAGNINILINNKVKDNINLGFNSNEVIMGDKFAKENYDYYPLGEKHTTKFGEYKVNCIISNSSDIYYNDLKILNNSSIKNQRLYVVLKDKNNKSIDENTIVSQLGSWGISMSLILNYANVKKLLIKIMILLIMILIIIALVKLYKCIKKSLAEMIIRYNDVKYDMYFRQFIFQPNNLKEIKRIAIGLLGMAFSVYLISNLTIAFVSLKMPYKLNPVSPKSIYEVIKLFVGLVSYYITNGMTEISKVIISLAVLYFIAVVVIICLLLIERFKYKKLDFLSVKKGV